MYYSITRSSLMDGVVEPTHETLKTMGNSSAPVSIKRTRASALSSGSSRITMDGQHQRVKPDVNVLITISGI